MNGRVRRPLPPGGLDHVLAAGRRRRSRARATTATATVAACAALVVATVLGAPGPGGQGDVTDAPRPRPAPSDSPAPERSPAASPRSGAGTTVAAPSSVDGGPRTPAPPAPGAAPSPVAGGGVRPPRPQHGAGPAIRGPERFVDTGGCGGVLDMRAWCTAVQGPAVVSPGAPGLFTFSICRRAETATARYATTQEAEFLVGDVGAPAWTWSSGYAFPRRPHTLTFEEGWCLAWTVEWDGTDSDGDVLPPGSYELTAYGTAQGWDGGSDDPWTTTSTWVRVG